VNPQWKQKWIEALRSGKYKQTRAKLRRQTGYCCLGVLCDLVDSKRWVEPPALCCNYFEYRDPTMEGVQPTSMPPDDILITTGLLAPLAQQLANLNDGGASFSEIAHWIEGNV